MTRRIKDLAVQTIYHRPKFEYGGTSSLAAKQEAPVGVSPGEHLSLSRGYSDGGAPQNPAKPWENWTPTNYKSWDDVPIINPQELVGKRIGSLEADLTRAGGQYTGIDQSQIENPEPMLGGPGYPLMDESQKHKLGWAVQGKGKGTQKLNKDFDYIAVHAMKDDAHRSNTSIVNSVLGTMKAYVRDKRIAPEGLETLKNLISKPSKDVELKQLENFPGFDSPELDQYIHSLGFKPRSALVDRLWSAAAEKTGSPQIAKILRDTLDKEWAGVPMGHAMYLLEVPKGSSDALVNLKKEGLPIHPSYDWGIHGRIVGRFAHPAARELLHEPWFKEKLEEHKEKIAKGEKVDINAAFRRALPVTTITQDIADRLPHAPRDIQSAKAAKLALNAFNDQWDTTEAPVTQGGLGPASLAQAMKDSDSSSTLTQYDPKELQKMVKSGQFTGYKLKDGEVYFGLKRGTNYADDYGFEHPDLTPNETALVSVVNNEPGAKGIGGAPVVLKAIQHGATALDAFAVPSKRHPNGFLPQFYSKFGFEELGRVPFDPQYVSPQQFESMKHEWTKAGWDESMGLPPLAIMKWRGSDKDRENAVRNYLTQSSQLDRPGSDTPDVASAARALQQGSQGDLGTSPRGRKRGDAGRDRGRVRDDSEARAPDRLARTLAALRGLSPAELEHFGIDPAQFERAKTLGLKDGGVADDVMPEIPNPVSVFPKPQRMFGPDEEVPGGRYINTKTKEDMTGHKASMASIGIGANGKPYLTASSDAVDETGSPGRGSAITKANLFKKKAGWRWLQAPEGHEDTDTIVSVHHRGNHHFALHAHYPKGVDLTTYPKEKNEPRLRPTTRGNVTLGNHVGTISVRGKEHPVYDHVIVKADGGSVDYIPHDDKRRARNLKDFHGKTPKDIREGRWLHGTTRDFQSFMRGPSGAIFLTQDPNFANSYARSHWGQEELEDDRAYAKKYKTSPSVPNVMPVHVRAEKPFDYQNKKHIAALYEELGPDLIMDPYLHSFMDDVREGHWGAIESDPIQRAIKAMGHDSFYVKEHGAKNLAVYDPSQIKSATGNQGTFDRNDPDITKADGGDVEYPLRHHTDWEEAHDYEKTGGKLGYESPGDYLKRVNPLNMDHDDKQIIHHFEKQIEKGEKLDPVAIYPDGHPNGRHRAEAAKKAGVKKIPVVTWPAKKNAGGPIVDRALMVISKKV
jgi:hypothetical protein